MGIIVAIQSALIFLLISKNSMCQKAIKLWILISLMIGPGLIIVGIILQSLGAHMQGEEDLIELLASNKMLYSILYLIVGIILWILNNEFGEVNYEDKDNINPVANNMG